MKELIIIGTEPDYLMKFRGDFIDKMMEQKIVSITLMVSATNQKITNRFREDNLEIATYNVKRNGVNPLQDIKTLLAFVKKFTEIKPKIILAYTIKPIIWGGIAARLSISNYKFYALITGLGFAFQERTFKRKLLTRLVTFLYRSALKRAESVIFQNSDNLNEFVRRGIVPSSKCTLVNGSGVDISYYPYTPLPDTKPIFLTIGRLLSEKGFREYAQAAQIVKARYPETTFQLLGPEDPSPDRIPLTEVQKWHQQGALEYLGSTDDVRPYLRNCHIYVLPSYHEGMPRTVLEAMAIGRPILTTDVPGCRETVIPGKNGWLVPKADVNALAERMIWFIENRNQWAYMSKSSRDFAQERYDVHKVNNQLMQIMGLVSG